MVIDNKRLLSVLGSYVCKKSLCSCCFQDSLSFYSLIITCLRIDLFFKFILLGVCWDTWMCRFMFFIKIEMFLAIISLIFSFFPRTPITCMLVSLIVPCRSLRFCSPFFIIFSFCSSQCWFILVPVWFYYYTPYWIFISGIVLFSSRIST